MKRCLSCFFRSESQIDDNVHDINLISRLTDIDCSTIKTHSFEGLDTFARIASVYDGDTCHIVFEWNNKLLRTPVRMAGYDSPEIKGSTEKEKELAKIARDKLIQLVGFIDGKTSDIIRVKFGKMDKYKRPLCIFYTVSGENINNIMIQEGYGVPYNGGKKIQIWN